MKKVAMFGRLGWAAAAIAVVVAGGCKTPPPTGPRPPSEPPPPYAEIAAIHNARVERLDSLWARVTVQVQGRDAEGRRLSEQAEGHLQIQRPDRVALSLGKIGETYFRLGSNDERYWWFDMLDKDVRTAVVGRHELVNPVKLEQLGVPVHPLDLPTILNIERWPLDPAMGGRTVWSSDGRYMGVILPGEAGRRLVWLDPETLQPQYVELQSPGGEPLVRARLSRERFVPVAGASGLAPTLASNYEIRVLGSDALINLSLWEPEVREINPAVFDFERLLRLSEIKLVRDLDADDLTPSLPGF